MAEVPSRRLLGAGCALYAGISLCIIAQSLYVEAYLPRVSPRRASPVVCRSSYSSYQSFQPLGAPMKKAAPGPGFALGLQNDTIGTEMEEYIVNITKPLGIAIEESPDRSGMVYVAEVGEKAEALGVEVGDVIVGCSFIFGDDWLVNVTGQGVDKVESMIRTRGSDYDYVCLRLRKGCDYHLLEPILSELENNEERNMKAEEKESLWINRARKIFIEEYPVDLANIDEAAVEDDDP